MGNHAGAIVGTWKLVSVIVEDVETGEQQPLWGERPNGCLVATRDGRWMAVQTAEGRSAPQSDAEHTAAFRSMLAYAGKYRTEGDRIVIDVDIAWDESWNGTEQVRHYRIDGDRLHIETTPQAMPNFGGRIMRSVLVWARER